MEGFPPTGRLPRINVLAGKQLAHSQRDRGRVSPDPFLFMHVWIGFRARRTNRPLAPPTAARRCIAAGHKVVQRQSVSGGKGGSGRRELLNYAKAQMERADN